MEAKYRSNKIYYSLGDKVSNFFRYLSYINNANTKTLIFNFLLSKYARIKICDIEIYRDLRRNMVFCKRFQCTVTPIGGPILYNQLQQPSAGEGEVAKFLK